MRNKGLKRKGDEDEEITVPVSFHDCNLWNQTLTGPVTREGLKSVKNEPSTKQVDNQKMAPSDLTPKFSFRGQIPFRNVQ